MAGIAGCLVVLLAAQVLSQDLKDVPDVAQQEIQRRGNLVERIGGHRHDVADLIAQAMQPPADDSHKWFISVVITANCRYCDMLKRDFASSPHLRPFVDVENHDKSWAHYNVFRHADQTQAWRWEGIKFGGFPTLIVQPPRNGRYGDAKTVVWQKTGYDGDAQRLANDLRGAIAAYVARQPRQGGMRQDDTGAEQSSYEPPFTPPPRVDPSAFPTPYPLEIPPVPSPTPAPNVTPSLLLLSLLGGMLSSGGVTNLLLLVLAGLALIRTFRKATGQKLLLDDQTYQRVVDTLQQLMQQKTQIKR